MKLEQQVCSLELAKKLKELGVKQDSLFYWINDHIFYKTGLGAYRDDGACVGDRSFACASKVSSFTVAELGEMLPHEVHFFTGIKNPRRRKNSQHLHCFFGSMGPMVNYTGGGARENYTQRGATEADARAKMLIYLLENNLIKLHETNGKQL